MPVSSYLAFPPLPVNDRRYISVALSLGSPPAAVSRYPCPVEPGLSSGAAFRHCIRSCLSHSIVIIVSFGKLVNISEKQNNQGCRTKNFFFCDSLFLPSGALCTVTEWETLESCASCISCSLHNSFCHCLTDTLIESMRENILFCKFVIAYE